VTLKAAVTLDGRIAARSGESKWITGEASRREVHRMRAKSDAVLVGVGTVLADDPELTVRAVRGANPVRVVLDSALRTPLAAKLIASAGETPTWIFHADTAGARKRLQLTAAGVELFSLKQSGRGLDLSALLRALAKRGVARLLVEGGAHVHGAFLEAGLVDEVAVFVAPLLLADPNALPLAHGVRARSIAEAFRLIDPAVVRFGDDVMVRGLLAHSARKAARARRAKKGAGPRRRPKL
jgi:diaminohydroxyphosphoribosylaminopyrimidine deaminase/5-amino-6-(5-phosphoribosylamino)uracil reductase